MPNKRFHTVLFLIALLLMVGAGALFYGPFLREQYQIDRCLDHGGHWDFKAKACQNP